MIGNRYFFFALWVTTFLFWSLQSKAVDFEAYLKRHKVSAVTLKNSSYCEWKNETSDNQINGYRTEELVRIASVSKLFTSYLALKKFGPFHRFQTQLTIIPVGNNLVDLEIRGSDDPYFNLEKVFFMISELNRMGVEKIRKISFDSHFRVALNWRQSMEVIWSEGMVWKPEIHRNYVTQQISPEDSQKNLQAALNTSGWSNRAKTSYQRLVRNAKAERIQLTTQPKLSFQEISFNENMSPRPQGGKNFVLRSLPLFKYLKDLNKYSINFLADQIFLVSGGVPALRDLLVNDVRLRESDFQFYTGSGLPLRDTDRINEDGERRADNLATCSSVIRTIQSMAQFLNSYPVPNEERAELNGRQNLLLSDVMMVIGTDSDGTIGARPNIAKNVVAKSGTLTAVTNAAGYASTRNGIFWFGVFITGKGLRELRNSTMGLLVSENRGGKEVTALSPVEFDEFIPFDSKSSIRSYEPISVRMN